MATIPFETVLDGLMGALARCRDLGLTAEVERSRFLTYHEDLKALVRLATAARGGDLTPQRVTDAVAHRREYVAALVESTHFTEIMRSLHDFDREILRPRLINVLRGPRLPADEDATSKTNSNGPRSTLFELNVAAILRDAGLQPELAVHPDVRCRVGDTPLFFECKRPISEARVAKRITEAGQQLQADLAAYASVDACGIIVLSLAKLFSPSQTPFPINTQRAAQDFLNGWLGAIVVDTERAWRPLVGAGRLIGILFHVAAVFVNEAKGRFDLGQWWIGLPLTEHPGVHPAYARLGEVLQASADLS